MSKPILCVDFDGVIHSYKSSWQGVDQIPDPPVPGALRWLLKAAELFEVVIYSSRSSSPAGIRAMQQWLLDWATEEFGRGMVMPVSFADKKPAAFLTIDDRAIEFTGDWSELDPLTLRNFKPWYQRANPKDRAER